MVDKTAVRERIRRYAGSEFRTATDLPFTYAVPGNFLHIAREGREINRSLSRTNFEKAMDAMPAAAPSELSDRQGPSYTWAILMDRRIRSDDW
ncbi:MAG: hypothetical protein ACKVZ6_07625 [Kineosporiaceae bacterium]